MKRYLMSIGYQYFREQRLQYVMGFEEAEAPDLSCVPVSPLANLLPFPGTNGLLDFFTNSFS